MLRRHIKLRRLPGSGGGADTRSASCRKALRHDASKGARRLPVMAPWLGKTGLLAIRGRLVAVDFERRTLRRGLLCSRLNRQRTVPGSLRRVRAPAGSRTTAGDVVRLYTPFFGQRLFTLYGRL